MEQFFKKRKFFIGLVLSILLLYILLYSSIETFPSPRLKLKKISSEFNIKSAFNIKTNNLSEKKLFEDVRAINENISVGGTNTFQNNIRYLNEYSLRFKEGQIDIFIGGNNNVDIQKLYDSEINKNFVGKDMMLFNHYIESPQINIQDYLDPNIKYYGANKNNMLYKYKNGVLCIIYEERLYPKGLYRDIDGWPTFYNAKTVNSAMIINSDINIYIVCHWNNENGVNAMQKSMNAFLPQLNNLNEGNKLDLDEVYRRIGEDPPIE